MGCRIDPWQASICLRLSRGETVHLVWSASPYGDLADGAPWSLSGWSLRSWLSPVHVSHSHNHTQKEGPEIMNETKVRTKSSAVYTKLVLAEPPVICEWFTIDHPGWRDWHVFCFDGLNLEFWIWKQIFAWPSLATLMSADACKRLTL